MPPTLKYDGPTYSKYLFEKIASTNEWKCKICGNKIDVKPGSGCSNFKAHLSKKKIPHDNADELVAMYLRSDDSPVSGADMTSTPPVPAYANTKGCGWIDWIVMRYYQLSLVEDPYARKYTNLAKISVSTLKKYIDGVVKIVEGKIKEMLPSSFGLVIDGWTEKSTHYLAVFATFKDNMDIVRKVMLACSPMGDETDAGADVTVTFFEEILELYGKQTSCIAFLVSDNTALNPAICRKLGIPFVGCLSHRFALAIEYYMKYHAEHVNALLKNIHYIMVKLGSAKLGAHLRLHCELQPLYPCETRWDGTFIMLERFLDESFLNAVDKIKSTRACFSSKRAQENFTDLVPEEIDLEVLGTLLKQLKLARETSLYLKKDDLNLLDAYVAIDTLRDTVEDFRWTEALNKYCAHDSDIVKECSVFTSSVCSVLKDPRNVTSLSNDQRAALAKFKKQVLVEASNEVSPIKASGDLMKKLTKKQKLHRLELDEINRTQSASDLYHGSDAVLPTSNICERLFSKAGLIFRDHRKSMLPRTLETLLFLSINRRLWDEECVFRVVADAKID
jgi:hypothetical protein